MNAVSDSDVLEWQSPSPGNWLARLAGGSVDSDFTAILGVLPAAIYITDAEGRITYFNEAAVQLWGQRPTPGGSMWCGSWKLFWADGRPMPHDECPMAVAIRERRAIHGERAVLQRPDGTRVPFVAYPAPLFDSDGNFVGAVNMLVDVGEREQADENAQRLSAIVESSDDAIISKDLDGVIMSWNAGAERIFGYTPDEVIGKFVTVLIPENRFDEEPGILARIRRGERIDHYETIRKRKDGTLIDISLCVSPIRNEEGRIVGASKVARDITEKKRAQEQQKLLLAEMKHRVKNTLATAQALAVQTLRGASKDELAAFTSRLGALASAHDLLTLESWNRIALGEVVEGALHPFRERDGQRFEICGPANVLLDGTKSLLLAMVLHELATNAVKYGALSNSSGRIKFQWELDPVTGSAGMTWQESGGPPVVAPERKGFGSRLISHSLDQACFDFREQGLVCSWRLALN